MKCLLVDAKLSLKKNRQIDHHNTTVIAANDAFGNCSYSQDNIFKS